MADQTLSRIYQLRDPRPAYRFIAETRLDGAPVVVVESYRSQARQDALYAQGRTTQGNVVTWTRNSLHTQRRAFDIAFVVNGRLTWQVPRSWWDYMRFRAARYGLRTLGETSGDLGHFEL